jgi:hypothetical protein
MSRAPKTLSQYMFQFKQELVPRFLARGQPVATNNLGEVARLLNGEKKEIDRNSAIIYPADGLPQIWVATENNNYREIFKELFEGNLNIQLGNQPFHADHVLPRISGLGRYKWTLLNAEDPGVNTSFGSVEGASSKHRSFDKNGIVEMASITECVKMLNLAPMRVSDLLTDCLVAFNGVESGVIDRPQAPQMLDMIRNSSNNLVREAYERNSEALRRKSNSWG